MKFCCRYIILFQLLLPVWLFCQSVTPVHLPADWKQNGYVLQVKDALQHPDMSWPVTLLQYRIFFGEQRTASDRFTITDAINGKPVAFQLADVIEKNGLLQEATLYLLTDLPTGTARSFKLQANTKQPASPVNKVQVTNHALYTELSNGNIRLQLPASSAKAVQPPVILFGNDTGWLGRGELPAAFKNARMQVQPLITGELLSAYSISYIFPSAKTYTVIVRLGAAMEFAELEETMSGFTSGDSLQWRLIWNGVQPSVRYASTRTGINEKGEPMEGYADSLLNNKHPYQVSDQRNDKDGKLPFRLALYDNWMSWWRLPTAAFWNEEQTIGVFIKDAEKWNDGRYALWGSKEPLSISYHWKNKMLDYSFPLVNGTRSVALAAYAHSKDLDIITRTKKPLAYIDHLRRYYGWIPLDKTKNWVLDYAGDDGARPKYFNAANANNKLGINWLEQSLKNMVTSVATGAERNAGPTPVGARAFYENIVPSFDLNRAAMSVEQYRKLRAWFLFMNYVFMDESLMPVRTMLSGHPNFLMDIKSVAGLSAFLFPGHPQAGQMARHFEKAIQLNYHYHIRPPVKTWNSQGGRWTENLATYTWAALRPTLRTNYLLHHFYDGRNRILQPGISELGHWLLNALTSPLQTSGRRGFPPQGAHAQDFSAGPPDLLRMLAQELMYYDPLLAEQLFWATDSADKAFEGERELTPVWSPVLKGLWAANKGTPAQLRSEKFTGYGIVLRSRFAQPNEMYVHLQQIDEGPNYRWGRAGGNGVIYYYANGKRYSYNGPEDVGDGPFGDVERCTNFGIKQPAGYRQLGDYRSIGRGDLTAPLYDFGFAQHAVVYGNNPAYRSRSILQSGADYIVVFDDVANDTSEGRFSWFTGSGDDFPFIHQLMPGVKFTDANIQPSQSNYHKDPAVLPAKGRYYDGNGDFLTVVTHVPEIKTQKTNYGAQVQLPDGSVDHVFKADKTIHYKQNNISFTGTSGIVKANSATQYEAALFAGSEIGAGDLRIQLADDSSAGINFKVFHSGYTGCFQSTAAHQVRFYYSGKNKTALHFYIDGIPVTPKQTADGAIVVSFAAGKHQWQWSATAVVPGIPVITHTSNRSGGCIISFTKVPGAIGYDVQISNDNCASWQTVIAGVKATAVTLTQLTNDTKVHCRILAKGQDTTGEPSAPYPIYITAKPPHCPEGLQAMVKDGKTHIHWGRILGAGEYKLYRKLQSAAGWTLVYNGREAQYIDKLPNDRSVYEYTVTAVNGNGESTRSALCDTDPKSFLNWYPPFYNGFRRDTENHENGFPEYNPFIEDKMPVSRYPD